MFSNFFTLPRSCVFLLQNKQEKLVYINYSENFPLALARLYEELNGKSGTEALELDIVSVTTDIETLKLHTQYWRDHYRNIEYSDLIPIGRKSIEYSVRSLVASDLSTINVELVTARGIRKVVGRFKTQKEADDFILTYYAEDNYYRLPVYAVNSLTKEFIIKNGKSKSIII